MLDKKDYIGLSINIKMERSEKMSAIYQWYCRNPECKMLNNAEQGQIDEAIKNGYKPLLICVNCGIGHGFTRTGTPQGQNWLACLPFEGWESRLPLGTKPDGTIVDSNGKPFDPDTFTTTYGVDAVQFLKWKKSGKPKPAHTC